MLIQKKPSKDLYSLIDDTTKSEPDATIADIDQESVLPVIRQQVGAAYLLRM